MLGSRAARSVDGSRLDQKAIDTASEILTFRRRELHPSAAVVRAMLPCAAPVVHLDASDAVAGDMNWLRDAQ